ncbi:MAG: hypothetical protein HY858_10965 [Candidatus Solibacter usitatus]|nr:hypothetical protein [Candidatus Solibacter usitatus]
MSKLTLSIDQTVILRAKRYAKRRGASVSRLVEEYLRVVSQPAEAKDLPPVLRMAMGVLKGTKAEPQEHKRHPERKYR